MNGSPWGRDIDEARGRNSESAEQKREAARERGIKDGGAGVDPAIQREIRNQVGAHGLMDAYLSGYAEGRRRAK